MKTSKATVKRFRVSASGRVKRGRSGSVHNTGKRSARWKCKMRKMALLPKEHEGALQRLLPYAGVR